MNQEYLSRDADVYNLPVPVAQLVERWTPCGENIRPG